MTNALTWRRITVHATLTHTGGSGQFGEDPIWFFGGVGYCTQDHPGLSHYLNSPNVRIDPVAAPPTAYLQAIQDLPGRDRERGRLDPPMQGIQGTGTSPHHFQGPYL